jgi:hypothetical protein
VTFVLHVVCVCVCVRVCECGKWCTTHLLVHYLISPLNQYIYGGPNAVTVDACNAAPLLRAWRQLRVEGLDALIRAHVTEALSTQDALHLLEAAQDCGVADVAEASAGRCVCVGVCMYLCVCECV